MIQDALIHKSILLFVSNVDSLEFRTRTLIQGVTPLYIDRGRGLRLSLEVPIGHTLDTVERFP